MVFASRLVRSFSTSSVQAHLIRPAIPAFGIDGRYSVALFSAASKQKKLDSVETDIKSLHNLWLTDTKMREYFLSPVNSKNEKKAGVQSNRQETKIFRFD